MQPNAPSTKPKIFIFSSDADGKFETVWPFICLELSTDLGDISRRNLSPVAQDVRTRSSFQGVHLSDQSVLESSLTDFLLLDKTLPFSPMRGLVEMERHVRGVLQSAFHTHGPVFTSGAIKCRFPGRLPDC